MVKFFKKTIVAALAFLPFVSLAQYSFDTTGDTTYYGTYGGSGGFWYLFYIIRDILDQAIILLISFGVVFLLYGIVKYIGSADDEENRKKGRSIMIYGIVGLFVMVSFWGFVNILMITFELDTTPYVEVPYLYDSGYGGNGEGETQEGAHF